LNHHSGNVLWYDKNWKVHILFFVKLIAVKWPSGQNFSGPFPQIFPGHVPLLISF